MAFNARVEWTSGFCFWYTSSNGCQFRQFSKLRFVIHCFSTSNCQTKLSELWSVSFRSLSISCFDSFVRNTWNRYLRSLTNLIERWLKSANCSSSISSFIAITRKTIRSTVNKQKTPNEEEKHFSRLMIPKKTGDFVDVVGIKFLLLLRLWSPRK